MTSHEINTIAAYVVAAALISLGLVIVTYLVMLQRFFLRLQHKHPEYYKELGEPSLFVRNSISKSYRLVRYLLDKKYLVVPDTGVNLLGERSRQLFFAATGVFAVTLVAFVVLSVTY